MEAMLMFKCPGPFKAEFGICYQYVGAKTEEEVEANESRGYFKTLKEAAEDAGPAAFAKIVLKNIKKKKPHKPGLPYVAPANPAVEPKKVEDDEETKVFKVAEEVKKEVSLGLNEASIPVIIVLLSRMKVTAAAKEIGVTWQKLNAFKKKHGLQ